MYRTWAVRRYDNNIATILKTSTLFIWRNLLQWVITCYCFLNKYSKQLFNYAAGIHRRKEDFLKERTFWVTYRTVKDPKPLRNKSWISLVKVVVTIISVISNTKGNRFWSRYFRWDLCDFFTTNIDQFHCYSTFQHEFKKCFLIPFAGKDRASLSILWSSKHQENCQKLRIWNHPKNKANTDRRKKVCSLFV